MVQPYPTTIVSEIMTVCNLKCPTCRVTNTAEPPQFMPFERFKELAERILPVLEQARIFNLCSSEPLLHKNFFDMVDLLKSYNDMAVPTIITNAELLDDETTHKLLARGLNSICISLDGCTKETFEAIRVGSNFERVIENTRNYIKKGGNVRTIFVVQKNNVHELLDFVDLCADLGIWKIKYSGLNTYLPEHVVNGLYSYEGNPGLDELLIEAQKKAATKKIQTRIRPTKITDCGCGLSDTMYIGKDGDISPCVFFSEPSPLSLMGETRITEPIFWGNVFEQDVLEIWHSKESVDFRENIATREECRLCGLKYGVVC